MRQTLTSETAMFLSGGGQLVASPPASYSRPDRAAIPPDEQTIRLSLTETDPAVALVESHLGYPLSEDERRRFAQHIPIIVDQDGTALISVGPVPAQSLADSGTLTLAAVPSRWDRVRMLLIGLVALIVVVLAAFGAGALITAVADAGGPVRAALAVVMLGVVVLLAIRWAVRRWAA